MMSVNKFTLDCNHLVECCCCSERYKEFLALADRESKLRAALEELDELESKRDSLSRLKSGAWWRRVLDKDYGPSILEPLLAAHAAAKKGIV